MVGVLWSARRLARWRVGTHILVQIGEVDRAPDITRLGASAVAPSSSAYFLKYDRGSRNEVSRSRMKRSTYQRSSSAFGGVEIDGEVRRNRRRRPPLFERARGGVARADSTLSPSTMRMSGRSMIDLVVGNDVVGQMRIDRRRHLAPPGLDVGDEAQQRGAVVALGKALLSASAPRARARRWGNRKPSVVTSVDARRVGPALTAARDITRVKVDLPAATEPATPMM